MSTNKPTQLLLIEDDSALAASLVQVLTDEGYEVSVEQRGDTGLVRAQQNEFHVVITDLKLPGLNGLEVARQLHLARPRLPILLMTAHGTTETAIEAMKFGAFDYMLKPFEMPEFLALIAKAADCNRLMMEPVGLGEPTASHDSLIGHSRLMQNIFKEIGRAAAMPVTVLIRGETGTGKELIARAIYQHSGRANAPFVAINCAAIPETLLESELFGHEKGAFTGADHRRIGRFEQAHNGTLFLDEIGDLSPGIQVKLLRVLQEQCIQRVGGNETIPVDVRIIAATHRDIESAIQQNLFREDLYYRLCVMVLHLPPLRERREDIPELVHYYLRRYSTEFNLPMPAIQPDAMEILQTWSYPGNVRELQNAVRKMLLKTQGYPIQAEHAKQAFVKSVPLPGEGTNGLAAMVGKLLDSAQQGEIEDAHAQLLSAAEREIFTQAIQRAQGNQAKAARWLGISRVTMRDKLHQFGLHPGSNAN